jgi:hypothetical protein
LFGFFPAKAGLAHAPPVDGNEQSPQTAPIEKTENSSNDRPRSSDSEPEA